jgi:beta-fructofuranosidase
MYSSRGFREWEIGDIDVIRRGRKYHLFHLVLPNHDYIAHAISSDGMTWERTRNAIFTGEPGAWDDDMLWTMHVSRNAGEDLYEMFYTGLHQAENGYVQRIGRAVSRDLMSWRKENLPNMPLVPREDCYEVAGQAGRGWVSFRDPFLFPVAGDQWMLLAARTREGAVNRRGCVGLARRTPEGFEVLPPLFFPRMYDDVECPCMVELEGTYYLIGSIREDVEVHYWWCDTLTGEYQAFRNNVLLPSGNYAARVTHDGSRVLLYSFFIDGQDIENGIRSLPPPKELRRRKDGKLELLSFHRWEEKVLATPPLPLEDFRPRLGNPAASCEVAGDSVEFRARSGFELFTLTMEAGAWIWEGTWQTRQQGRCGLVFGLDDQLSGYFIAVDTERGTLNILGWGSKPDRVFQNYTYKKLQGGEFNASGDRRHSFRLLRWKSYIELSVDGVVRLSLVDARFMGKNLGVFVESGEVALSRMSFSTLEGRLDPARGGTPREVAALPPA